ncbi:MAG: DNA alkylation repair protein, partial [Lactiplantibacillus plantarum]|nr:DNA alkylation repair protein [Lactiplantibacillus plantarum]
MLTNRGDDDFFIQKAIGWALRDYGKVNPEWG